MNTLMSAVLMAVSFLIGHIPRPVATLLGSLIGRTGFRFDKKRRGIALGNLEIAFGDEKAPAEKDRIIRTVYENLATMFFEFMRIPWLRRKDLPGYVDFIGLENFDHAFEKKKGVILLTGHFGNWEMLAAALALKGYPMDAVVRDLDNPVLDSFVRWVREGPGNTMVSKSRAMRKLIKRLSANGMVAILLDQNVASNEGVFVDFLGTPACTNKGPALLAATTGAAVVPAFIISAGGRHTLVVSPEIELSMTGDRERDTIENTARCTRAIEQMVKSHPEQWFWVHRRWKTRPPAETAPGAGRIDKTPLK